MSAGCLDRLLAPTGPGRGLLLCAAVGAGVFFLLRLGHPALLEPDEGRYADVSRAMLLTGDWLTPRMNFIPNFGKPPLFFWLTAATMRMLGPTELAARLWSAIAGAGLVAVTVALARRLLDLDVRSALLAGAMLATSPLVFVYAHLCTQDMLFAALLGIAFAAFFAAVDEPAPRLGPVVGGWIALGLAVLAKGPTAVAFPTLVFGAFLLPRERRALVLRLLRPSALAVFLAIVLPWHVAMARTHPDWASIYLWQGHVERAAGNPFDRSEPAWFYLPVLAFGFFPWILFALGPVRRAFVERTGGRAARARFFLLLWAVLPVAALSLPAIKMPHYILPVAPALCLLAADGALRTFAPVGPGPRRVMRSLLAAAAALAAAAIVCAIGPSALDGSRKVDQALALFGKPIALAFAVAATGCAAAAGLARTARPRRALVLLVATAGSILLVAWVVLARMDEWRGSRRLAEIVARGAEPGTRVVMYHRHYRGLAFYLGAPVVIWDPNIEWIETPARLRDPDLCLEENDARLLDWLHGDREVRLVVRDERTLGGMTRLGRVPLHVLGRVGERIVLTNRASAPGAAPLSLPQAEPGAIPGGAGPPAGSRAPGMGDTPP